MATPKDSVVSDIAKKNPESFLGVEHFRTKSGKTVIHPSEDELEAYMIGYAPQNPQNEGRVAAIEEHLLICGPCLDWVEKQERTIGVLRECLRRPVETPPRKTKPKTMAANQGWLF
jgi:hypothetical protein